MTTYTVASGLAWCGGDCQRRGSPYIGYVPMTLALAHKGARSVVLAVDSALTLETLGKDKNPTFHGEEKLLMFPHHGNVAAAVYGRGVLGVPCFPRPATSFIPMIEEYLGDAQLPVAEFAIRLRNFFTWQWHHDGIKNERPMQVLIAGYDPRAATTSATEPYGKVFTIKIPSEDDPCECLPGQLWIYSVGQDDVVQRLLCHEGTAVREWYQKWWLESLPSSSANPVEWGEIKECERRKASGTLIPVRDLPTESVVELLVYLINITSATQSWYGTGEAVGGDVNVAVITPDRQCITQRYEPMRLSVPRIKRTPIDG